MEATDKMEAAVNSLLAPVEDTKPEPETQDTAPEPELEAQEVEAPDDDAEQAELPEDTEDEADANDTAEDPETQLHTVKAHGKESQVTLEELKRSWSAEAHRQKGMREAAEIRKQAEAIYSTLQAEQAKLLQTYEMVKSQGFKAPPQAPDIAMMDKDPIGYMQARARYEQDAADFQNQQAELRRVAETQRQLQDRALSEFVKDQGRILQERIPEFADASRAKELTTKIRQTGVETYGFSEQELSGIVDARHVQVLHDAMKWRELQSAKALQKKAPEAPRTVRPGAHRPEPEQLVRKKQIETARKSGKPQDFVELLLKK